MSPETDRGKRLFRKLVVSELVLLALVQVGLADIVLTRLSHPLKGRSVAADIPEEHSIELPTHTPVVIERTVLVPGPGEKQTVIVTATPPKPSPENAATGTPPAPTKPVSESTVASTNSNSRVPYAVFPRSCKDSTSQELSEKQAVCASIVYSGGVEADNELGNKYYGDLSDLEENKVKLARELAERTMLVGGNSIIRGKIDFDSIKFLEDPKADKPVFVGGVPAIAEGKYAVADVVNEQGEVIGKATIKQVISKDPNPWTDQIVVEDQENDSIGSYDDKLEAVRRIWPLLGNDKKFIAVSISYNDGTNGQITMSEVCGNYGEENRRGTPTPTPTEQVNETATPSVINTRVSTPTPSKTATVGQTVTETATNTRTRPAETPTPSKTATREATATNTKTITPVNTPTDRPYQTPEPTRTPHNSPTRMPTSSVVPTVMTPPTPEATNTRAVATPTEIGTVPATPTDRPYQTPEPTRTPHNSPTRMPTSSVVPTVMTPVTPDPTNTPNPIATPTPLDVPGKIFEKEIGTPYNTAVPGNTVFLPMVGWNASDVVPIRTSDDERGESDRIFGQLGYRRARDYEILVGGDFNGVAKNNKNKR